MNPWLLAFGSELNEGTNSASVVAGNGVGNFIGGDVVAHAEQHVGDVEFGYDYDFGSDTNIGVNTANVVAGNGAFNAIGGDVVAVADQQVGDADLGIFF